MKKLIKMGILLLVVTKGYSLTAYQAQQQAPMKITVLQNGTTSYPPAIETNGLVIAGSITLVNVRSGTQCLHADSQGRVTGTGGDCGSGGGSSYVAPSITLGSSPSAEYLELGTTLTNIALSAFTVKNSSPILNVTFYRGATQIYSVSSPHSSGGTETYTDTGTISGTTAYTATVSDALNTVTSNSIAFTFLYPFYYGVGAQALTGVQVQSLTKILQPAQNTEVFTSPTEQVYYYAYPQAYGVLANIKDQNGFNVTAGYTRRSVTLTMLDSTSQPYYIYEFNTVTTQTSFGVFYNFN